jgi:hypothetical protein
MAERILSPGVFSRENDLSFVTPAPGEISTALVGPTAKGQVGVPTIVRSYGEYLNVYGSTFKSGSDYYSHFTSLAAEKYFDQGGTSLLVTRVSDQSFSSATAEILSGSTEWFTLSTIAQGEIMNSTGSMLTDSAIDSGSADNLRWEITNKNVSQGTFSLLLRRGDDNHKSKIILESYQNVSLDPTSTNYISKVIGDQYRTVGLDGAVTLEGDYPNSSRYVYVSNVGFKTPDYLLTDGTANPAFSQSFEDFVIGSGSYGGSFDNATGTLFDSGRQANFYQNIDGTDTQGLDADATTGTNYDRAALTLANRDEYRYNVLLTPGINKSQHSSVVTSFVDMVENRGDAIYVADLYQHGGSVANVTTQANSMNSSFAAAYWPWVKIVENQLGKNVWSPASTVIGGVYAFTDRVGAEWFAPAGLLRGGIPTVVAAERKLSQSDRDSLYQDKVNPLATFPGSGVVAYGQKTLQTKASALDRVNVRRLLINLKNFIGDEANNLVFEQNTIATRNRFLATVNPYLESVVQRQGLYAYRVVMDDTNNTADVIDRNQLVGQIFIQPTKTAEFIVLDFVVQPTGASFGA